MTIGIIAKLTAQAGKGPQLEALFGELTQQVRTNEPGNIVYQLTKVRGEDGVYKVVELYRDQDALNNHLAADHFRAASAQFATLLTGRPDVEFVDGVG